MVKKKLPIKWDKEAVEDLRTIYRYIKKKSPDNAEKVKKELLKIARGLNSFPEKYPEEALLKEEKGNFRSITKWHYKIIYEITSNEIIIIMIFHTSQHPSKIKNK